MSLSGLVTSTVAPAVVPSANASWMREAPSTTCSAVSTAPAALMTTPLPEPGVDVARIGALGGDDDERRRDRVVGDRGVRWGVALLLLRLLQAALHGLVDVGRGEGRRPGGPSNQAPSPSTATTATAT